MRCHELLCIGRLVSKADKVMYTMHILDSTNDPELDETICYEIIFSDSDDSDDSGPLFPTDNSDGESEVTI